MSNNIFGESLRTTLGLGLTAPSSVTTYSATLTTSGVSFQGNITDGTDGTDDISVGSSLYTFGMGGNIRHGRQ